jgi:hypothetical protein
VGAVLTIAYAAKLSLGGFVTDKIEEYARLAAEAFLAASASENPVRARDHRALAYRYVDLLRAAERKEPRADARAHTADSSVERQEPFMLRGDGKTPFEKLPEQGQQRQSPMDAFSEEGAGIASKE